MLDPKHWPAALTPLADTVAEAARPFQGQPVRIELFDGSYEISVRVPRAAVEDLLAKKGA